MESATDIISLSTAKEELAVDFDDDDTLITGQIAAAVSWVENYLHRPLLQRRSRWSFLNFDRLPRDLYICIPSRETRRVTQVRYWTPTNTINNMPDGVIESAGLGRITVSETSTVIYPSDDGWPEVLTGSPAWVETVDESRLGSDPTVKAGIVQVLRSIYNGQLMFKPGTSFKTILGPRRSYVPYHPDTDLTPDTEYVDLDS